MARKKKEEGVSGAREPTDVSSRASEASQPAQVSPLPAPALPDKPSADIGASLYRDRSAPPRVNTITEGQANFETITRAARGILPSSETE
jgi:hypothetical protein